MKIKTAPLGQLGANFYIVYSEDQKEIFAVDPGDCPDIIKQLISDTGCELKYIILTHAHVDHIGALDELKKTFNAPVVICSSEADSLNNEELNLCSPFGASSPKTKADITVCHGDTIPFGSKEIKFLHTPGHTVGSMCICYEDAVFTGDTLFNLSIGRCDFPGGNFDDIIASIKNKLYTLPGSTTVYPGHGDASTIDYEKNNNPFVRG